MTLLLGCCGVRQEGDCSRVRVYKMHVEPSTDYGAQIFSKVSGNRETGAKGEFYLTPSPWQSTNHTVACDRVEGVL